MSGVRVSPSAITLAEQIRDRNEAYAPFVGAGDDFHDIVALLVRLREAEQALGLAGCHPEDITYVGACIEAALVAVRGDQKDETDKETP